MNKFHKRLFFDTSNKVIWSQKSFNCMHGLKSDILEIFQKLADWLDWLLVHLTIFAHRK